jgi:uncharacterized protein YndB with AHSA1/START domain
VPSFTRSIAIRRSPEQVFAVLDDLEQAPKWMPAIRRIDVLTPGMRMGVGYRWRETRRVFGILRVKFVLVLSAHDPPRTWGLTFNDGKVQATATFELSETPSGTQVTFVEEVEDLQGKGKRAARMAKMMEKQDHDLLERLKAHLESTTEEPPGLLPDAQPSAVTTKAMDPVNGDKAKAPKKAKRKVASKSAKKAKPAKKR